MRIALLVISLTALGCGDSGSSGNTSGSSGGKDLSMPDLTVPACAGADQSQNVPCDPADTDVCYPNSLTYCVCRNSVWTCCGDNVPMCPDTPAAPGGFCCPGGPPATLDCPYACSGGHRTVCTCTMDFEWVCGSEACNDGGP